MKNRECSQNVEVHFCFPTTKGIHIIRYIIFAEQSSIENIVLFLHSENTDLPQAALQGFLLHQLLDDFTICFFYTSVKMKHLACIVTSPWRTACSGKYLFGAVGKVLLWQSRWDRLLILAKLSTLLISYNNALYKCIHWIREHKQYYFLFAVHATDSTLHYYTRRGDTFPHSEELVVR